MSSTFVYSVGYFNTLNRWCELRQTNSLRNALHFRKLYANVYEGVEIKKRKKEGHKDC